MFVGRSIFDLNNQVSSERGEINLLGSPSWRHLKWKSIKPYL